MGRQLTAIRFCVSDPFWSLAMAINVYLVFFHSLRSEGIKKYLWLYCLLCYGTPAVLGVFGFVFNMYGDATVSLPNR